MITLTKSIALDYAKYGIRVNAICPAGVWTPILEQWCSEQPNPDVIRSYLDEIHALGYSPKGDVVADAAAFLLSDRARFLTAHRPQDAARIDGVSRRTWPRRASPLCASFSGGCILPVSGGAELGRRR